jgi:glucan phosphorylase
VKHRNKVELANWLDKTYGLKFDPSALFDAQCKRIHEYKRQHLNLLHAISLFDRVRRGEDDGVRARSSSPARRRRPTRGEADHPARPRRRRRDQLRPERARERLRVVFIPDFSVKTAQRIYPAADLSEQISTAGMEASGTGNMKFGAERRADDRHARRRERRDPRVPSVPSTSSSSGSPPSRSPSASAPATARTSTSPRIRSCRARSI